MTIMEISLIIIGVIIMIGSFFIKEKISIKDMEKISELSEIELDMIVEKQLKNANGKIDDAITDMIDESMDLADRAMEKETNQKIMAISEYSDTVLDSMNKTHNEIMFLYSMLNDKHEELTKLAGELQQFSVNMKNTENEVLGKLAESAESIESLVEDTKEVDQKSVLEASVQTDEENNHNNEILICHKEGKSDIEIAKELGLGLGEVKLVLGLFKGEEQ